MAHWRFIMGDSKKIRVDWSKLTDKQKTMVQEYIKTGNKLGSYRKAFYPNGDEAERIKSITLQQNCYREFKKPHIAIVIEQVQERAIARANLKLDELADGQVEDLISLQKEVHALQIDAMWVLKRAALLADFNINKFIKVEDGKAVYDFSGATEDDWFCIQEYVSDMANVFDGDVRVPVEKIKIKAYDKLRALELVGKHVDVKAFRDTVELSGDPERPIHTITRRIIKAGDPDANS